MVPSSFNRIVIDLDALKHNFQMLRKRAGDAVLLAMVKADGYGHGMIECARALEESGCDVFGVAELREAVLLRQAGIHGAIYAMIGFDPIDADLICRYDITPLVYDNQSLQVLSDAAVANNRDIVVHVKVDCGMTRLGIWPDQVVTFTAEIQRLPRLSLGGIAGHFPCSDDVLSPSTARCFEVFKAAGRHIDKDLPVIEHVANSAAILHFPETHCDMVRCGISLYGYYPDGDSTEEQNGLRPVMSFRTRVLQVKEVPAGTGVSYGHTYITERDTHLAVLAVGYEDGYCRHLSNRGEVLIHGRRAPIRGRVCMNLTMVDVTGIEGVAPGDDAILLGRQGEEYISADEIAAKIGTISYEVLCMLGNNNEREFV